MSNKGIRIVLSADARRALKLHADKWCMTPGDYVSRVVRNHLQDGVMAALNGKQPMHDLIEVIGIDEVQ